MTENMEIFYLFIGHYPCAGLAGQGIADHHSLLEAARVAGRLVTGVSGE